MNPSSHQQRPSRLPEVTQSWSPSQRRISPAVRGKETHAVYPLSETSPSRLSGSSGAGAQHSYLWSSPASTGVDAFGSPNSISADFRITFPQYVPSSEFLFQEPSTYGDVAFFADRFRSRGAYSQPTLPSEYRSDGPVPRSRPFSDGDVVQPQQPLGSEVSQLAVSYQASISAATRRSSKQDTTSSSSASICRLCEDPRCSYKPKHDLDDPRQLEKLLKGHKRRDCKEPVLCGKSGCTHKTARGRKDNLEKHRRSTRCPGFRQTLTGTPPDGPANQHAEHAFAGTAAGGSWNDGQTLAEEEVRRFEDERQAAWLENARGCAVGQEEVAPFYYYPPLPTYGTTAMELDPIEGDDGLGYSETDDFDNAFWAAGADYAHGSTDEAGGFYY
ncbi:hypothetical protein B0T14DRAFT_247286 [Immersiella caudata]|uniref:Uncharacterized protein n=1 Tax=Immersiella caudata TaxID=314043 RepID=A0AA39WJA8_9PEZI|nr:hypothetical protein B0T14DRAFT_247286 [Immersiella caudata]